MRRLIRWLVRGGRRRRRWVMRGGLMAVAAIAGVGVLLVHARQGSLIEVAVVAAVLDPGRVIDTHDVLLFVVGHRKSGEWQEPASDRVGRQLVLGRALEPDHGLFLSLALIHLIGVRAGRSLGAVSLTARTSRFVGDTGRTLEEGRSAAFTLNRVHAILV